MIWNSSEISLKVLNGNVQMFDWQDYLHYLSEHDTHLRCSDDIYPHLYVMGKTSKKFKNGQKMNSFKMFTIFRLDYESDFICRFSLYFLKEFMYIISDRIKNSLMSEILAVLHPQK